VVGSGYYRLKKVGLGTLIYIGRGTERLGKVVSAWIIPGQIGYFLLRFPRL
jgi:hypothetical protein